MARRSAEGIITGVCCLVLLFALGVVAYLKHDKGAAGIATTSTSPPSAPVSSVAPREPTRLLWQRTAYPHGRVLIEGGYLIEAGRQGVTVLNIRAGRERWRFREPGLQIANPTRDVTAHDGQVTLRLRDKAGTVQSRTLDLDTGRTVRAAATVLLKGSIVAGTGSDGTTWQARPTTCTGTTTFGQSVDYVFIARQCGTGSLLTAVAKADGSQLWQRSVRGAAVIDPQDPHAVMVYEPPTEHLPGMVGQIVPPSRLLIVPAGICRATSARIGCLSGSTGKWLWSSDLPAGAHVVAGDRTLLAYRVQGDSVHAGVLQIADGVPTMPDRALSAPPIVNAPALRILYTQGVLAIGDDRQYALYANPV